MCNWQQVVARRPGLDTPGAGQVARDRAADAAA